MKGTLQFQHCLIMEYVLWAHHHLVAMENINKKYTPGIRSLPVLGVTCYISNALRNIITFVVTK